MDRPHRGAAALRLGDDALAPGRDTLVGQGADLAGEAAVARGDVVGGAAGNQADVDVW